MKELTDQQLNIAICKLRGIQPCFIQGSHITGIEALGNMHEAEKDLTYLQEKRYTRLLIEETLNREVFATARQRGIAWLVAKYHHPPNPIPPFPKGRRAKPSG